VHPGYKSVGTFVIAIRLLMAISCVGESCEKSEYVYPDHHVKARKSPQKRKDVSLVLSLTGLNDSNMNNNNNKQDLTTD